MIIRRVERVLQELDVGSLQSVKDLYKPVNNDTHDIWKISISQDCVRQLRSRECGHTGLRLPSLNPLMAAPALGFSAPMGTCCPIKSTTTRNFTPVVVNQP